MQLKEERTWPKLPEIYVLFGPKTVEAYYNGERNTERLNKKGVVKHFSFPSIQELNAFIRGLELARGHSDVLPVEGLYETV